MSFTKHQQFNCPICNELIGPWSRGITFHARFHNLTIQQFWMLKNNIIEHPKCQCSHSCNELVNWVNWETGFSQFKRGHLSNEIIKNRKRITKKEHWTQRQDEKTKATLKCNGEKISKTLKSKHYTSWSKGHTKETNKSLQTISEKSKNNTSRKYTFGVVKQKILETLSTDFILLSEDEIIKNRKNNHVFVEIKCNICNNHEFIQIYNLIRKTKHICKKCMIIESTFENNVRTFLQSKISNVEKIKLESFEIDIFLQKYNFAIECNGLYWHCNLIQKNKQQHQYKTNLCKKHNIHLFHLYEDEWFLKQEIVQSMLLHKLKLSNKTIYARNTKFRIITQIECQDFFNKNSIKEFNNNTIKDFGLSYNNELILVASVSNKDNIYMFTNFCIKQNTHIPGGLSKICKNILIDIEQTKLFCELNQRFSKQSFLNANWKFVKQDNILEHWYTNKFQKSYYQEYQYHIFGCYNDIMLFELS